MNLLPGRAQRDHFFEEGNEVATGVASCGFAVHAAGLGVQRGIQRKRAMPVVLEPVTLGAARRERQNRVEPIQGLNRGLFIDTEHGRMLRRMQVQTDNVGRFAFELGIVAGQVTLQAVGFETGFFPDPMHGVFADSQRSSPVCGNSNAWNHRWVSCGWPTESGPAKPQSEPWPFGRDDKYRAHRCPDSRKRCFQRMIVGALVCSLRLMVLKEAPSASIRMSLARKT